MNIFYVDSDPVLCARQHTSKHCIKMILESCQLLSTAHRVLDGTECVRLSSKNRKKKVFELADHRDQILYSATHINHPSAIWVRQSSEHYNWLVEMTTALCKEYTFRYGKVHKCEASGLLAVLTTPPTNITHQAFTEPPQAMPENIRISGDSVKAYREYIMKEKRHLASWRGKVNSRAEPSWYA